MSKVLNDSRRLLYVCILMGITIQGTQALAPYPPKDPDSLALDKAVQKHIDSSYFEGVVLVAEQGNIVYQRAHGLADRENQKPIQSNTRFLVASVTKMITSILVLQFIEKGSLALDTKLHTLLPDLSIPQAKNISVQDLLLHTSGLPKEKDAIYRTARTPREFLQEVLLQKSSGKMGSFQYNNVDYVILGLILEKLSGNSWEILLKEQIIRPLGLKNTGIVYRDAQPENFAHTYQVNKKGTFKKDPPYFIENFYAAGSLYSNAEDLLKIEQALYTTQILDSLGLTLLERSFPQHGYAGFGVWNYTYPFAKKPVKIMERRGGILGANVVLTRLPEENKTLIILSNNERFNPDSWGNPDNLREALMRIVIESD